MHTHMGGCTYQGVIDSTTLSTRFTSCTSIHTICVDRCTLWTILPSTLLIFFPLNNVYYCVNNIIVILI